MLTGSRRRKLRCICPFQFLTTLFLDLLGQFALQLVLHRSHTLFIAGCVLGFQIIQSACPEPNEFELTSIVTKERRLRGSQNNVPTCKDVGSVMHTLSQTSYRDLHTPGQGVIMRLRSPWQVPEICMYDCTFWLNSIVMTGTKTKSDFLPKRLVSYTDTVVCTRIRGNIASHSIAFHSETYARNVRRTSRLLL